MIEIVIRILQQPSCATPDETTAPETAETTDQPDDPTPEAPEKPDVSFRVDVGNYA